MLKLAISNIAWDIEEESQAVDWLKGNGVQGIEIAPTKKWAEPIEATNRAIIDYKEYWDSYNMQLIGMQALLFGKPELTIFETEEKNQKTKEYLIQIVKLASKLGINALVFGSPKNRIIGNKNKNIAWDTAILFFKDIGKVAEEYQVSFCIEPNPKEYGCDFINTISEGIELVQAVNSKGLRLHLDTGAMFLNNEDATKMITLSMPYMSHFHVSEPFLESIGNIHRDEHIKIAKALVNCDYQGWISIEMKNGKKASNLDSIVQAVNFVNEVYKTN